MDMAMGRVYIFDIVCPTNLRLSEYGVAYILGSTTMLQFSEAVGTVQGGAHRSMQAMVNFAVLELETCYVDSMFLVY